MTVARTVTDPPSQRVSDRIAREHAALRDAGESVRTRITDATFHA